MSEAQPLNLAVWVAEHRGMVGFAFVHQIALDGCHNVMMSRSKVRVRRQGGAKSWLDATRPADFLSDNLAIEANIINAAWRTREKLLFPRSSCIFPSPAPQTISEDALLTGPLEPANKWYACREGLDQRA